MKYLTSVDHRLHVEKIESLIDFPKIIKVTEFTEDSCKHFEEDIQEAHDTNQPVIPIMIDSYGGQVYSLFGMLSAIEQAKVPVATICTTKAMSCGSALFAWGTEGYRYMDPNATIMIHDVSCMQYGKIEEIKAGTNQSDRLNNQLFTRMAKKLGHPKNYFLDMLDAKKHAEWYLSAREAKKHNIVNELRIPEFRIALNLEMNFV